MSALDRIMEEMKQNALILMEDSTDRDVLEAIVAEGAPMVLGYKMRGVIPHPQAMVRIATYLLALSAAMERKRLDRRKAIKETDNG